MWVFGYGSLIWNPGFEYEDSRVGHIRGYSRRFWQGNDFHRGSKQQLGRVATLVEDEQGVTWGRAFLLGDESDASLKYLESRESRLGGYSTKIVTFHAKEGDGEPLPCLVYLATANSPLYLGAAPLPRVAEDIAEAKGQCGHNAEYLFRLTSFMRDHLPHVWDEHLYALDHLVRARLKDRSLSPDDVMGDAEGFCPRRIARLAGGQMEEERKEDFVSRVPTRTLRCLDI